MLRALTVSYEEFSDNIRNSDPDVQRIASRIEKSKKFEAMSAKEKKIHDFNLWYGWVYHRYTNRLKADVDGITDKNTLRFLQSERVYMMNQANPRFILRNYIAQNAIAKAENGDYEEVRNVLKRLENPFDDEDTVMNNLSSAFQQSLNVGEMSSGAAGSSVQRVVDELVPDWALASKVTSSS